MHRERDSIGRFTSRGRNPIPTLALTPPQLRSDTLSTQTHIPSIAGRYRLPEVHKYEIQPKYSPTSSTRAVIEEEYPTSPIEVVTFLSSTRE